MTMEKKKELLADILDVDVEEIEADKKLAELGDWGSLAILSFIAMMDEEFEKEIKGDVVKNLVTVSDAFALMEE